MGRVNTHDGRRGRTVQAGGATRPGMDVTNLTVGASEFTCNAYLVAGAEPTLVDAGAMSGIEAAVAEHTDQLDRVVVTHQHPDHIDELETVVEAFEPAVLAYADHPLRTAALDDGDQVQLGPESYDVVHTPGHASDHVALVGENALFSGDVVVYNDGAYDDGSFGRTDLPGASRARLVDSLQTLIGQLPEGIDQLYPGHGDPYTGNVQTIVDRALSRAERREPKYPGE